MIAVPPDFKFIALWPRHVVGDNVEKFVKLGEDRLKSRVQFLEDVMTADGAFDVLFAVHRQDILPFWYASPRFNMVRLETALDKSPKDWYPERLSSYRNF